MKLYDVPNYSYVKLVGEVHPPPRALPLNVGEVYYLKHIDGMYSYCTDKNDDVVHLKAWAEVEIVPKPENKA